eukprot:TRINITY_DN111695_c0_g1_i1.p1 TRINITY_DN111695_c0_g1~~TRINITY_DN111695_c0_g1_i1.p1  ORF type:complete len:550 (-),score=99.75 TRINITY_DN111695_c0_g1_i1:71-1720(-)
MSMMFNFVLAFIVRQALAQQACNGTSFLQTLQRDGSLVQKQESLLAGQVSCSMQEAATTRLRAEMALAHNNRFAPMFIRGVFHDAMDANNLMDWDEGLKIWVQRTGEPLDGRNGWSYGGVDGCMYSTLADGGRGAMHCEDGESSNARPCPDSQHNRNIGPAMTIAEDVCKSLGWTPLEDCVVDMFVLGAIIAVQDAGGPVIPMSWGRSKGSCKSMTCDKESCKDESSAMDTGLPMFALDNLEVFGEVWAKLGFNVSEQVALMGAHTFGKANLCAGGLNGVMRGHWCSEPDKLEPPLREANLDSCHLQPGKQSGCWGNRANAKSAVSPVYVPQLYPVYPIYGDYLTNKKDSLLGNGLEMLNSDMGKGVGFGDGGIWDQTPEVFDNNYFKLVSLESAGQKDVCCGPVGDYGERMKRKRGVEGEVCLEVGDEKKSSGSKKGMHNKTTGELINHSDICGARWCRYGDKTLRSHMKSPTLWHEVKPELVKKPWKWGAFKRLIRLSGDWALLLDTTKPYVEQFANDQDVFFTSFSAAFEKVTKRGYNEGELHGCV